MSDSLRHAAWIGTFDQTTRQRFLENSLSEQDFSWILELALQKTEYLPSLCRINLYEVVYWNARFLQLEKWHAPSRVRKIFEKHGIDLAVHVRAPKPGFSRDIVWNLTER